MNSSDTEQPQAVAEFEGNVVSSTISGLAKLKIEKDGLIIDSIFKREYILYENIEYITFDEYTVILKANGETVSFSHMGQSCEWFYRKLSDAYNNKVKLSFHITASKAFETEGQYFNDGMNGKAIIQVYADCLCILPPNQNARRIPFVFVNGIKNDDYSLTLTLSTGEIYAFSMLGRDIDMFKNMIISNIRKQKDNNFNFVKSLNPSLSVVQCTKADELLSEGVAVQLNCLTSELAETVTRKVMNSKIQGTYRQLLIICDKERLAVGIKRLSEEVVELLKQELLGKLNENTEQQIELSPEQEDALRWALFLAIPSKDGKAAVVEFAFPGEDAATYLFRTDCEWNLFLSLVNRSMEATEMQRELLSYNDETLKNESHGLEQMIITRTPALKELRSRFIGRVIHRSTESWKNSVLEKLDKVSKTEFKVTYKGSEHCNACGAIITFGIKFCGECGNKL
jgi:hypothetical protein